MARRSKAPLSPVSAAVLLLLVGAPSACVPEAQFRDEESGVCENGTLDTAETDVDCGGACSPCALGKRCAGTPDCAEGSCIEGVCRRPSCADSSLSPGETDIDCGGAHCAPCKELDACEMDRDCESQNCQAGRCQATLSSGGAGGDGDDVSGDGDSLGLGGSSGGAVSGSGGESSVGGMPGAGGDVSTGGMMGTGGESSGGTSSGGASSGGTSSGGASSGGASSGGASGSGGSGGGICELGSWAFCDDFEDGNSSGWQESGGDWDVVADGPNFVFTGAGGSEEATAGQASWTDQVVEARVKVLEFGGSGGSYRAGVIARFSGPSDFFTVAFDATGNLRLLKSTSTPSGASGTCGAISYPIAEDTWYKLRLEVSGGSGDVTLRSYVDDVLVHDCHSTQSSVNAGKAGVLTVGSNTVAAFDDVTVSIP